uniref:Uncharacterized protein n=1 Tax=Panagrellus redivivus TaxID=6233 RepID=A0A7E4VTE7_PANRE
MPSGQPKREGMIRSAQREYWTNVMEQARQKAVETTTSSASSSTPPIIRGIPTGEMDVSPSTSFNVPVRRYFTEIEKPIVSHKLRVTKLEKQVTSLEQKVINLDTELARLDKNHRRVWRHESTLSAPVEDLFERNSSLIQRIDYLAKKARKLSKRTFRFVSNQKAELIGAKENGITNALPPCRKRCCQPIDDDDKLVNGSKRARVEDPDFAADQNHV